VVAGLVPLAGLSELGVFGLEPLTVWGSLCLLLLIALWWDELSPRVAWNAAGFVARGPRGLHRGTWSDALSVYLLGLGGRRRSFRASDVPPNWDREATTVLGIAEPQPSRYRLVIVTPSGRFELVPSRFWWMEPISGRHTKTHQALEEIRAARDALDAHGGVPPRLMPPLAQLILVVLLWLAGLAVGTIVR
jgi:hypothetical protein